MPTCWTPPPWSRWFRSRMARAMITRRRPKARGDDGIRTRSARLAGSEQHGRHHRCGRGPTGHDRSRTTPPTTGPTRKNLVDDLTALDKSYRTGLATCKRSEFITTHAAFGYLARAYDLTQIGINGLSPDSEPSPARIADVQQIAKEHQDHHDLLRDAGLPRGRPVDRRRPRAEDRRPRPDRRHHRCLPWNGLPFGHEVQPDGTADGERLPVTANEPVLTAEDLTVELGGLPVLRGVGLAVGSGEAVTLLGGNGSGKSTLVRALLGLTPHQRGSVRLFGTELSRFSDWKRVGYVPQRSTAALSNALVREVVAAGRLSHRRPFVPPRRSDRTAIGEALAHRRHGRPRGRRAPAAVRWAAAARADRARAGGRTGPARAGRTQRRRRSRAPADPGRGARPR